MGKKRIMPAKKKNPLLQPNFILSCALRLQSTVGCHKVREQQVLDERLPRAERRRAFSLFTQSRRSTLAGKWQVGSPSHCCVCLLQTHTTRCIQAQLGKIKFPSVVDVKAAGRFVKDKRTTKSTLKSVKVKSLIFLHFTMTAHDNCAVVFGMLKAIAAPEPHTNC